LLYLGWRRSAVFVIFAMAGAFVLEVTLKLAFHRPRPTPFFGPQPSSYSFPSGHALASFCFYGVLAGVVNSRVRHQDLRAPIWIASALLVAVIGFSRIYLGVHHPTDVMAGYAAAGVLDQRAGFSPPVAPLADYACFTSARAP
jgi:undecaprenyl-diphosphatase